MIKAVLWALAVCIFATIATVIVTPIIFLVRLILAMADLVADSLNLIIPEK